MSTAVFSALSLEGGEDGAPVCFTEFAAFYSAAVKWGYIDIQYLDHRKALGVGEGREGCLFLNFK